MHICIECRICNLFFKIKFQFVGFEYVYVTTAESRSISTGINGSPHRMEVDDVDPEDVRLALNELVQQLAFAETEKVGLN